MPNKGCRALCDAWRYYGLNEVEGMGLADAEINYELATAGVIVVFAFWAKVTFACWLEKFNRCRNKEAFQSVVLSRG